jgi:type IV pilus assembly protein PilV
MSAHRTSARRRARGYTIIELVMSLSVLAIGASGIISMQKVAVSSNRHAKDLSVATRIAEAWADQLTIDGALWTITTSGASTRDKTTWLRLADPTQTVDWLIPGYDAKRSFGPAFGPLGAPLDPGTSAALAHFCAHLRFAFLHSDTAPSAGNGVIRAQIRVFWQAEDSTVGLPSSANGNLCAVDNATLTSNIGAFHVVYLTTAVRQSPEGL